MFKNAMQKKLRQRFYVTLKAGIPFDGVLIHSDKGDDGHSVYADVVAYPEGDNAQQVKGELYVPNTNIAYSQLVT